MKANEEKNLYTSMFLIAKLFTFGYWIFKPVTDKAHIRAIVLEAWSKFTQMYSFSRIMWGRVDSLKIHCVQVPFFQNAALPTKQICSTSRSV